jgi:hypothetical protein
MPARRATRQHYQCNMPCGHLAVASCPSADVHCPGASAVFRAPPTRTMYHSAARHPKSAQAHCCSLPCSGAQARWHLAESGAFKSGALGGPVIGADVMPEACGALSAAHFGDLQATSAAVLDSATHGACLQIVVWRQGEVTVLLPVSLLSEICRQDAGPQRRMSVPCLLISSSHTSPRCAASDTCPAAGESIRCHHELVDASHRWDPPRTLTLGPAACAARALALARTLAARVRHGAAEAAIWSRVAGRRTAACFPGYVTSTSDTAPCTAACIATSRCRCTCSIACL